MLADVNTNTIAAPADTTQDSRWQQLAELARKFMPIMTLVTSRGCAIIAQFVAQLVVGAMAGASGLGILQLFTSWTCIAGEVLGLGLPTRAMRRVSVDYGQQQKQRILHTLQDSRRKILRLWLALFLLSLLPALYLLRTSDPGDWAQYTWLLIGAGLTAPVFSLLRLYAESLKATGAALTAVTLESLTSPLALLLVCAICWLAGKSLLALTLVTTFALSLMVTTLAMNYQLKRRLTQLPQTVPRSHDSGESQQAPQADLFYLWCTSVLGIAFLHLPFMVMPLYVDTAQIGVFAVAHKLINVITTLLLLLAALFGPAFARSAARRDPTEMSGLLRRTQLISTAVFVPVSLALIGLAQPLAGLFGEDFGALQLYLAILAAGYLINAATGLSGVLLNMAGVASRELLTLVIAFIAALAGSAWAGPEYGATGLAVVFSASIALKNIASYVLARHYLNSLREQA